VDPITNLAELHEALDQLEAQARGHHPTTVYIDPPLRLRLHPTVLTDGSIVLDIRASTDDADRRS
jgi:hypothetical protein